jgi:diguanylate cyclase (GGDEF)-like protein
LWAAAPAPLTTLRAIHALTNVEARQALPVDFESTVVFSRRYENLLFVQDGDAAVFVLDPAGIALVPGDRIRVRGTMRASFHPIVVGKTITLLHHGAPPPPTPATFGDLIRARYDCRLVTVHAVVRAADLLVSAQGGVTSSRLQLLTEDGHIEANLDNNDASALKDLLDTEVEITGVAAGKFDNKMEQTGAVLYVPSLAYIKVIKRAGASPWSLPVTPMDLVLIDYKMRNLTPRVRVHGTITYYQPGSAVVLQDGAKSLWISTHTLDPLQIGDQADATGFPDAHDRLLTLTDGEVQDSHIFQPVSPQLATWQELGFWSTNQPHGHLNDLVSIEGQVVTEVREAAQDEYVVLSDGRLFTAIYRHPPAPGALPPMKETPPGSRIRVTGICVVVDTNNVNPGFEVPFDILMRTPDDIVVVVSPSLLNIRNLILVVCALLLVVFAVIARGWALERNVRRQTAALAHIEHRRSQILEEINGSRPLAEIIEAITELASFKLHGAPCWCQIADGARLGNCPPQLTALRIVQCEIPARSGPPLGAIFAAFGPLTKPSSIELESLSAAVGLATLAIETRRLYSDLLHRSEFDLLTDIHNRFSLEKQLDARIEEARENAGVFGLIYVDLDDFKRVNDLYGHRVGDLYLQEVAERMKRQLGPHDLLARLGGDEFAVLLPKVHNRAEVEEIAQRLEHCFDAPLILEGRTLQGTASFGIALYPEDNPARDGLLSVADAAMYAVKNLRKQAASESAGGEEPAITAGSRG